MMPMRLGLVRARNVVNVLTGNLGFDTKKSSLYGNNIAEAEARWVCEILEKQGNQGRRH